MQHGRARSGSRPPWRSGARGARRPLPPWFRSSTAATTSSRGQLPWRSPGRTIRAPCRRSWRARCFPVNSRWPAPKHRWPPSPPGRREDRHLTRLVRSSAMISRSQRFWQPRWIRHRHAISRRFGGHTPERSTRSFPTLSRTAAERGAPPCRCSMTERMALRWAPWRRPATRDWCRKRPSPSARSPGPSPTGSRLRSTLRTARPEPSRCGSWPSSATNG